MPSWRKSIKKLEAGDSTLEESFTCYEAGMKLVKYLSGQIDNVRKTDSDIE